LQSPRRVSFARTIDQQIDFEIGTDSAVVALVVHRDGEEHRAKRLAPRIEMTLPAETLSRYVGTYELRPGLTATISLQGERFIVELTGQSREQLFAESEDHFFLKTVNAQIEFTGIQNGPRASGLIIHQGGRNTPARRR
jgi:hypothetical protein